MSKILWTNILRSLIICAIVMLVACGLNIGVNYLSILIFGVTGAPFWLFGMIAVGISWTVLGMIERWGKETELFFPEIMLPPDSEWITRAQNGKTIKWSRLKLSLLPHLLVGIAMIVIAVLQAAHWLELGDNPPENPLLNTVVYSVTAVITVMVVQLGYYRMYQSHYRDMRCDSCHHVFCLVNAGIDSVSESYNVEQQENNESREVEFQLGDHVYSGRTEGSRRSRLVTTKTTHFNCRCVICGNEQLHSEETGKEEGDWSEWH